MSGNVFDKKGKRVRLDDISPEPPKGMTRAKAEERFKDLGKQMFELQDGMWGAKTRSVMVVLQGRDSAGKDGAIKHVVGMLNPRGVHVVSFGVPTEEERQHDLLWRVHKHAPRLGEFSIFNRSHYEDVLVVRVHDLIPKSLWKERYGHIADFEECLAEHGTIVLKFFLHISKKEQAERLRDRLLDKRKHWKFDPTDLKARARWNDYMHAYSDAIEKCSSEHAPWYVIPADHKWFRNWAVSEILVRTLQKLKLKYPPPAPGLDAIVIK